MVKVLIVEDAPFIVESFEEIIEDQGWESVGVAKNGIEAVDQFKSSGPDVILMDILMPEMDGVSAIKEIMSIDRDAKIIVITALAKRNLDKECLDAGAKVFIKKPFDIDELVRTIKSIVED